VKDEIVWLLRSPSDRIESLLRSGGVDASRFARNPSQPGHFGLAQELVLPLPRE
jgi:hypothetical protein